MRVRNFVTPVLTPREDKAFQDFLKELKSNSFQHMDDTIVILGSRAEAKKTKRELLKKYYNGTISKIRG